MPIMLVSFVGCWRFAKSKSSWQTVFSVVNFEPKFRETATSSNVIVKPFSMYGSKLLYQYIYDINQFVIVFSIYYLNTLIYGEVWKKLSILSQNQKSKRYRSSTPLLNSSFNLNLDVSLSNVSTLDSADTSFNDSNVNDSLLSAPTSSVPPKEFTQQCPVFWTILMCLVCLKQLRKQGIA